MLRVIADFADAQDGGYVYHAGDTYPRNGTPSPERVKELSGTGNRLRIPLIVEEKASKGKRKVSE